MSKHLPHRDTAYHKDPRQYDRTRGLPDGVQEAIVAHLLAKIGVGDAMLDLGAGSGRFAIPLAERGARVFAADLSAEMLRHLLGKCAQKSACPLPVQADAMRLPFRSAAFGSAFSVHTLHLVENLARAIKEIERVLKNGGIFALGYIEHEANSPIRWVLENWRRALAERGYDLSRPMWRRHSQIVAALRQKFGPPHIVIAAQWQGIISPAEALRSAAERLFTPYWGLPDEEHVAIIAELERAATEFFGNLNAPLQDTRRFVWHFFEIHRREA